MTLSIGVLEQLGEQQVLQLAAGRRRITRTIAGLGDFADLARAADVYQLWIHRSWSEAHPNVELPGEQHWHVVEVSPGRRCMVVICRGDESLIGPPARAADGRELLSTLLELDGLLGTHWRGTPARTGASLLLAYLDHHSIPLGEVPPVPFPVESDFGWRRPLLPDERRRKWLYEFDKHQFYLVAGVTVELGIGDPELRDHPTFHARTPGLWHVKTAPWSAEALLPDPTSSGPPRARDGYRWLTTPSVEAACAAGIVEDIAAAWYWPVHGRHLRPFAAHMRACLARARTPLVRDSLKATYATTLGGYLAAGRLKERDHPLYRPDWRDALKAEARTRLWYTLRNTGLHPVAIAHDAIFVPSDADTATDAAGALVLGPNPREWAYERRVRLADVLDVMPDRHGPATRLSKRVAQLAADGWGSEAGA